jgi:F-type H+-transporting ATPase subunit gamma
MSGLKQLRIRVKTIKSTQKITKAMQMVSASKLAKVKHQISDSDDYLNVLSNIMTKISSISNINSISSDEKKYFISTNPNNIYLLILFTSERGLCGGFNLSVIRQAKADIARLEAEGKQVKLMLIGKKGYDALKNHYAHYIDSYFNVQSISDTSNILLQIKDHLMRMLANNELSSCNLYYNKFKNAMTQIFETKKIFPIENLNKNDKSKNNIIDYDIYEYEGKNLIINLVELYISGQINYAMLQSKASEEGSRMTAMDNATSNAGDIINKLTLKLNRSRQAIITKELTEIISGAEAI